MCGQLTPAAQPCGRFRAEAGKKGRLSLALNQPVCFSTATTAFGLDLMKADFAAWPTSGVRDTLPLSNSKPVMGFPAAPCIQLSRTAKAIYGSGQLRASTVSARTKSHLFPREKGWFQINKPRW